MVRGNDQTMRPNRATEPCDQMHKTSLRWPTLLSGPNLSSPAIYSIFTLSELQKILSYNLLQGHAATRYKQPDRSKHCMHARSNAVKHKCREQCAERHRKRMDPKTPPK